MVDRLLAACWIDRVESHLMLVLTLGVAGVSVVAGVDVAGRSASVGYMVVEGASCAVVAIVPSVYFAPEEPRAA